MVAVSMDVVEYVQVGFFYIFIRPLIGIARTIPMTMQDDMARIMLIFFERSMGRLNAIFLARGPTTAISSTRAMTSPMTISTTENMEKS